MLNMVFLPYIISQDTVDITFDIVDVDNFREEEIGTVVFNIEQARGRTASESMYIDYQEGITPT